MTQAGRAVSAAGDVNDYWAS